MTENGGGTSKLGAILPKSRLVCAFKTRYPNYPIPFRVGWGFSLAIAAAVYLMWRKVAIPFRVGWGFSPKKRAHLSSLKPQHVAIPFRVGWGFSRGHSGQSSWPEILSRNPFQGGMGFFTGGA